MVRPITYYELTICEPQYEIMIIKDSVLIFSVKKFFEASVFHPKFMNPSSRRQVVTVTLNPSNASTKYLLFISSIIFI